MEVGFRREGWRLLRRHAGPQHHQYAVMREDRPPPSHARPDTAVVDLGCSRGEALAPLVGALAGQPLHRMEV